METLTLYELNCMVREVLERTIDDEYWLQAELSEVREASNGHCYLEFVEKDKRGRDVIAKARGTIWSNIYRLIKPMFQRETGRPLSAGMKVLVRVAVNFHELYGYSLTVTDIDATYTIGDLAKQRKEILDRLAAEGILSDNKDLPFPLSANRIAVISSAGAAGYGDFCDQLLHNDYGLRFDIGLFSAIMQGDRVEASIIKALDAVMTDSRRWDVVVIIRGGGATSDLIGFDTYLLAAACAQFPIPIITGIGHERDETVLDYVAHTRVKTPTAVAAFLVGHQLDALTTVEDLQMRLMNLCHQRIKNEQSALQLQTLRLNSALTGMRSQGEYQLKILSQRIIHSYHQRMTDEKHRLTLLEQECAAVDPEVLLKRGFSMTFYDGHLVREAASLKSGDRIVTRLADGEITSVVD